MASKEGAGPSHILSSVYNQSRIVDVYLQSTLSDSNFPTIAIQSIESLLSSSNNSEQDEIKTLQIKFYKIEARLSIDQRKALKEAIKAISLSLINQQSDNNDKNIDQCILLGFCKILNLQWIEAIVDLDLIRNLLYSKIIKNKGNHQEESSTSVEEMRIYYIRTLYGLQLASALMNKEGDIVRYRRWCKQEQESAKGS